MLEIFAIHELCLLISSPTVPVIMVKLIDTHTIKSSLDHGHDHSAIHRTLRDQLLNADFNSSLVDMNADEARLETIFIMGKKFTMSYITQ